MFIRRGCTLYNVHCTNVHSKHSVRLLPGSSIGLRPQKNAGSFLGKFCGFLKQISARVFAPHLPGSWRKSRRVTRPVVNDIFRKLNFPSPSLTFSFSPHLIFFFPTFELLGRNFCHLATVQCTHLSFVHCTLVLPTEALSRLSYSHRVHIFTRDETGLVYLPTQLERTLQLYWWW